MCNLLRRGPSRMACSSMAPAKIVGVASLAVAMLGGCPKRRELPPDPPGMKRAEGGKVSVPLPDGWEQLNEGADSIVETAHSGGVTLVNQRPDAPHGGAIVLDMGQATTRSWSQSECRAVADRLAPKFGPAIRGPEVLDLPTGQTCHFVLKGDSGVVKEFYYLAGRPPLILVCRTTGPDPRVAEDCQHVASWIRRKR